MKKLKSGYTTGACAAVCVKAALLSLLENYEAEKIEIDSLNGKKKYQFQ